jgi:hypothetical protein
MDVQPLPYPWERQQGESDRAYRAFQHYMNLPTSERSIARVALDLVHAGAKPVSNRRHRHGQFETWATQHSWVERAAAWDDELHRRKREAFLKANEEASERMALEAESIQQAALVTARAILQKITTDDDALGDLAKRGLEELLPMLRGTATAWAAGNRAERLARGMTTDHADVQLGPSQARRDVVSPEEEEQRLRDFFAAVEESRDA